MLDTVITSPLLQQEERHALLLLGTPGYEVPKILVDFRADYNINVSSGKVLSDELPASGRIRTDDRRFTKPLLYP